jgi:hypothetical protein
MKVLTNKVSNKRFQKEVLSFLAVVFVLTLMIGIMAVPAYAGDPGDWDSANDKGLELLDLVISWIATWAGRIGLVVAFFGALQTALGFMNDDADSKVRGLKLLAAGFMVWGISQSYTTFFSPN